MKDAELMLIDLIKEIIECEESYQKALLEDKHFDKVKEIYLRCKELKKMLNLLRQSLLS